MAIITKLPGIKIINGFKGILDFYYWMGIPCVRSWPRKPQAPRSPAVQAQWSTFTYIAKAWNTLDPDMRELYNRMASGTIMTGRDLFHRGYVSGLYAYPTAVP